MISDFGVPDCCGMSTYCVIGCVGATTFCVRCPYFVEKINIGVWVHHHINCGFK